MRVAHGAGTIAAAGALLAPALVLTLTGCGGPKAPEPLTEPLPPITVSVVDPFEFEPLECASAILIEADTGTILFEQNADEPRAPASIVKMTLELVVMELIARGELSLDDPVKASAWASQMGGSQVYLKQGEIFPLSELMKSIAIASANDACVAVAEHVAAQTDAFVDMMNSRVKEMGLEVTTYVNVHGLDDTVGPGNVTTAREVAAIGREVCHHPEVLEWSQLNREPFRDGTFILENTNTLIGRFPGMDGIKTGYTERAGYNLCATARRRGMRLVSVVMGADTRESCAAITSRLMARAFQGVRLVAATTENEPVSGPVVVGQSQAIEIRPLAGQNVRVVVPIGQVDEVKVTPEYTDPLLAPLVVGSPVGEAVITMGDRVVARVPMVSDRAVEAKGLKAWVRGITG